MTDAEFKALEAEAERLWAIFGERERPYREALHAWCEADTRLKEAKLERRIEERLRGEVAT
jgi:hypothetical protein